MDNKDQPIHPIMNKDFIRPDDECKGLTKREYFAAMAMQGLLSHDSSIRYDESKLATISLRYADGLLALLNKETL